MSAAAPGRGATHRWRFPIRVKFAAVGVALVATIGATGLVGVHGLGAVHDRARDLYLDNVRTSTATARLGAAVARAQLLTVESGAGTSPAARALRSQLDDAVVPEASAALAAFDALHSADTGPERGQIVAVDRAWQAFLRLRGEANPRPGAPELAAAALDPAVTTTTALSGQEQQAAAGSAAAADHGYTSSLRLVLAILAFSVLLGVAVVAWLTGAVVPRVRGYARFAEDVASGTTSANLAVSGRDELTDLGRALVRLVERARGRQRYEQSQAEMVDALQVAEDEAEAHEIVQRHLQRTVAGGSVTVFNRNNSANRLQAMTPVPVGSHLSQSLVGATPRACLALRFARAHTGRPDADAGERRLLDCAVCGLSERRTRCQPLLVGGEVIGSVLVEHTDDLTADGDASIADTVTQSAPVLANLRNLALAEFRANNDGLTGLANKRASQDSLTRMVALAARTASPLSAVLLDLDHFKAVNDRYGHGAGDEVLAAVGATLTATLRASDLAGRFGGEEFLVLLPDTDPDSAHTVAEAVRQALAQVRIPGTDQTITVSLGIATVPHHAGDPTTLLRLADRALYAAKAGGRNRTVTADAKTPTAAATGTLAAAEPDRGQPALRG